jgi:putative phage-type endonuclease
MTASFKRIDLEQGSEDWLSYRYSHIMATDTAAICGKNPFKTPFMLYKQKTECTESFVNAAMERGKRLEGEAREFLERKYGCVLESPTVESLRIPFMGASLDAFNEGKKLLIEIKCSGAKAMQEALEGKVSEMYNYQCQKQMFVTGLEKMFLFFYHDESVNITIKVFRNEDMIKEIKEKEQAFWNCLVNFEPPEFSATDFRENMDVESNLIASRLLEAMQAKKRVEEKIEGYKKSLKEIAKDEPTKFVSAGLRCTPYFMPGRVDYKKAVGDLGVSEEDLAKYKKPKSLQYRFSEY